MKKIGRAPWAVTTSLCFLAYRWNTGLSWGWIGHWLQSAMITASNWRPGLLKTISLFPTNEYFPIPSGLEYDSMSGQAMPDPLMVTEVVRGALVGAAARTRFDTWVC